MYTVYKIRHRNSYTKEIWIPKELQHDKIETVAGSVWLSL
jgi:hypothetical protein